MNSNTRTLQDVYAKLKVRGTYVQMVCDRLVSLLCCALMNLCKQTNTHVTLQQKTQGCTASSARAIMGTAAVTIHHLYIQAKVKCSSKQEPYRQNRRQRATSAPQRARSFV